MMDGFGYIFQAWLFLVICSKCGPSNDFRFKDLRFNYDGFFSIHGA